MHVKINADVYSNVVLTTLIAFNKASVSRNLLDEIIKADFYKIIMIPIILSKHVGNPFYYSF